MAVPILKATLRYSQPPDMSQRAWQRIQREALAELALKWHQEILPQHFTSQAPQKYGHQPRRSKYLRKKHIAARWGEKRGPIRVYAKYGGNIDNVFSGELENRVKAAAAIRATPTRVKLTLTGPRYMTMRRFVGDRQQAVDEGWTYGRGRKFRDYKRLRIDRDAGLQPDKAKEITTVTTEENDLLVQFLNDRVVARFSAWSSPRTIAA
jgi:hypothetical protein